MPQPEPTTVPQPEPSGTSPPGPARSERPLGRGLADVSHVFLSREADPPGTERAGSRPAPRPLPREESGSNPLLLRPVAQASRDEVAAALKDYAGALEDGLRAIDVEVPCPPWGEIDLLAVDRANQLAIIDFDTTSSDEILIRGLGHFDWAVTNVPNLRRMLRGLAVNFSLRPRLFLIAPLFSSRVRRAAHQVVGLQIDWVRYHLLETPGHRGIFFERVTAD